MQVNQFGDLQRIHFIGIGGIGMSGIAQVLFHHGYTISGSDIAENAITRNLIAMGIHVSYQHTKDNLAHVDVVVVSSAISRDNEEWLYAEKQGVPVLSRAEMLAELMRFKCGIAVSGTHGKTTTTSLIAHIFKTAQLDPTYVIGGVVNSTAKNADCGGGQYLITEADESDASFVALNPMLTVVTNIDDDHMQTYAGDSATQDESFLEFIHKVPFYGYAVLCGDDRRLQALMPHIARQYVKYGVEPDQDFRAIDIEYTGMRTTFTVERKQKPPLRITLNMPGRHNVLNALAAIAVASICKIADMHVCAALESFGGIGRRFQIMGQYAYQAKHFTLVDDYGHHPTELRATIATARQVFPHRPMLMIFQPHRYSRTAELWQEFVSALGQVDQLILLDIYPGSEAPLPGIDSMHLAEAIARSAGIPVNYSTEAGLYDRLCQQLTDEMVVLCQGAGSVSRICRQLATQIARHAMVLDQES